MNRHTCQLDMMPFVASTPLERAIELTLFPIFTFTHETLTSSPCVSERAASEASLPSFEGGSRVHAMLM